MVRFIKKNNPLKGKVITMLGFQTKILNAVIRNSTPLRQVATKGRYYSQEVAKKIDPSQEKNSKKGLNTAMKLGSLALAGYGGFKLSSFLNSNESYQVEKHYSFTFPPAFMRNENTENKTEYATNTDSTEPEKIYNFKKTYTFRFPPDFKQK